MEIRILVDGIERSVSGITDGTTCAQIIYALAHATRRKGRFVLIERFQNTERSLAPLDRPVEMLRKRDAHSHNVTFLLKHLDENPPSASNEMCNVDTDDRPKNSRLKDPSFNAVEIPVPQNTQVCVTNNKENRGLISSINVPASTPEQLYLPIFQKVNSQTVSTERIRNRPPPPAYHEVIEQRCTSLSRQNTPSSSLTPLQSADTSIDDLWRHTKDAMSQLINLDSDGVLRKKVSSNVLEELVQNQKQVIGQQKAHLSRLDFAIDSDQQREVIQLRRQQENLRAVLNPLRECNWPNRLHHERTELQKITASINEFKQKLDAITNEIKLRTDEEHRLEFSIMAMEEELKQLEDDIDIVTSSENDY